MAPGWKSANSSTTVPYYMDAIKKEVASVAEIVRRERTMRSVTIAVAQEESLGMLAVACEESKKWYHFRSAGEFFSVFSSKPGIRHPLSDRTHRIAPPTVFTTADDLQLAIDRIKTTKKRRILNLLVSPALPEIAFHVPSHFHQLRVLRCAPRSDKQTLLIEGSSTYHHVRLDRWQVHHHRKHELIIGHERGVRIKLTGFERDGHWARARKEYTASEREELRTYFDSLPKEGSPQWDKVKGSVAAIVGIVVGTAKFGLSIKAAAGGFYTSYAYGLHALKFGAAGAKLSVTATAAGPAVLLGVTAAAMIYYVPWPTFFAWLKGVLSWLWDKICQLWGQFTSWLRSLFSSEFPERPNQENACGSTPIYL